MLRAPNVDPWLSHPDYWTRKRALGLALIKLCDAVICKVPKSSDAMTC